MGTGDLPFERTKLNGFRDETPSPGNSGRDEPQGEETSPSETTNSDSYIAYAGVDGNIWLTRPDGTDQQPITTSGTPERAFLRPRWSPDGTMLVFQVGILQEGGYYDPAEIYLYREGLVSRLPRVHTCEMATFNGDGTGLLFACGGNRFDNSSAPTEGDLQSQPSLGFLSGSLLDSRGWQPLIPFSTNGTFPGWVDRVWLNDIATSPLDGTLAATVGGRFGSTLTLYASGDYVNPTKVGETTVYGASFAADGQDLIAHVCDGTCFRSIDGFTESIVRLHRDGTRGETFFSFPPDTYGAPASLAPNGSSLTYSLGGQQDGGTPPAVVVVPVPGGMPIEIARGRSPVWQPVPVDFSYSTEATGVVTITTLACRYGTRPDSPMPTTGGPWMVALPATVELKYRACKRAAADVSLVLENPDRTQETITLTSHTDERTLPVGRYALALSDTGAGIDWELTGSGVNIVLLMPDGPLPESTEPPESTSGTVSIVDLLPTLDEVPLGMILVEEGGRSAEEITSTFPHPDDAARLFAEWGWTENAYRIFAIPDGVDADPFLTTSLDVSIHQFGGSDEAALALGYLADSRSLQLVLADLPGEDVGDLSRLLGGEVGGEIERSLYVRHGSVVIRITGISPQGDPTQDLLAVARAILVR